MLRSGKRRPFTARAGAQRGSVTAEAALAIPGLLLVLVASLWGMRAAAAQVACVDAARVGARAAARGEPLDAVRAAAISALEPAVDARVEARKSARFVHVTVTAEVPAGGGVLSEVPALPVAGRATALREDR